MEELKNNLKYCLKVVAIWGLLFLLLCIMVQVSGTLFVNQPDILSFICLGFIVLGCVTPVLVNKNKSSKPTNKFVDKVFSRFDIFTIFLVGMYIFVVVMDVEKFSENFISNFLNFLLLYTFFYLYLINWNAKKYSVTAKSEAQKEIIMLIKSLAFIACPVFFIMPFVLLLSWDEKSDFGPGMFLSAIFFFLAVAVLCITLTVKVIKDNDSKYVMSFIKNPYQVVVFFVLLNIIVDFLETINLIFIDLSLICMLIKIWGVCILIPIIIYNIIRLFSHIKKYTAEKLSLK